MAESRRRLSPDERRNELLALGAEVFGQRPYDEVRIDEIAERAGVSRALMYHYFPDKRTFFAAVVRAEGDRLFEATNTPPEPGQSLFAQVREGVLAYVRYDEEHPHGAWAAYVGIGGSDPVLRGIEDVDNDRDVPPAPARPVDRRRLPRGHLCARPARRDRAGAGHPVSVERSRRTRTPLRGREQTETCPQTPEKGQFCVCSAGNLSVRVGTMTR
jgi:AcrR family transcriptional regulator